MISSKKSYENLSPSDSSLLFIYAIKNICITCKHLDITLKVRSIQAPLNRISLTGKFSFSKIGKENVDQEDFLDASCCSFQLD